MIDVSRSGAIQVLLSLWRSTDIVKYANLFASYEEGRGLLAIRRGREEDKWARVTFRRGVYPLGVLSVVKAEVRSTNLQLGQVGHLSVMNVSICIGSILKRVLESLSR
jgi:hypothetical protein